MNILLYQAVSLFTRGITYNISNYGYITRNNICYSCYRYYGDDDDDDDDDDDGGDDDDDD